MYSIDARKIALSLYEFFGSMRKAAKAAKVSASSISKKKQLDLNASDGQCKISSQRCSKTVLD
jgi:hypothetical protein